MNILLFEGKFWASDSLTQSAVLCGVFSFHRLQEYLAENSGNISFKSTSYLLCRTGYSFCRDMENGDEENWFESFFPLCEPLCKTNPIWFENKDGPKTEEPSPFYTINV